MLGPDNAIWDDGEWVGWDEINSHLFQQEMRARYPKADPTLVPFLHELLEIAQRFHRQTGRHLHIYGDIGELFGAVTYGIRLNKRYSQGSDGRLGNDLVEIKTITPFKSNDTVEVRLDRNFSKLLLVRIDERFEISGQLVDRKRLPKCKSNRLRVTWGMFDVV